VEKETQSDRQSLRFIKWVSALTWGKREMRGAEGKNSTDPAHHSTLVLVEALDFSQVS